MAKVAVYNQQGEKQGDLDLSPRIFGVKPDLAILEQAVRTYLADHRKAIGATKTRSEVAGGGKKPWAQKGTGRARHGSIRSPLWKGGGVTFGPRADRNWGLKMNKITKKIALAMSLSDKVNENTFVVLESLNLSEPKSKILSKTLKNVADKAGVKGRNYLLVVPRQDKNIDQAGRNLSDVKVVSANGLNVFDILNSDYMVVLKDSLSVIEKTYAGKDA